MKRNYSSVALTVVVTFLCLFPFGSGASPKIPYFDKIVHFLIFSTLSFKWLCSTNESKIVFLKKKSNLIVSFCCLIYGLGIEFTQEIMGLGRAFEWVDFFADATGTGIGLICFILYKKYGRVLFSNK